MAKFIYKMQNVLDIKYKMEDEQMKKTYNGLYVAKSDFGTYSQKTAQDIESNSKNISQIFSDIELISNKIATEMQTNAWIRSGLLEESNGIPIYGIEVGQKTEINGEEIFNKFARFTAEGIYFYLPGSNNAIAWLSGTTLFINKVEITGSLKMVKYICDLSDGICRLIEAWLFLLYLFPAPILSY